MSSHPPESPRLVLFERNRVLSTRIARVLRAAQGLAPILVTDEPAAIDAYVLASAQVIACDATEIELALDWAARAPHAKLLVWCGESPLPLVRLGAHRPALSNLIGWPSFDSMPRTWELLYVVRRLFGDPQPSLRELFPFGSTHKKFRPRTTADLETTVAAVTDLAERAGTTNRSALRVSEAAHELLMNAMYDAPVDQYGEKRFAFRRNERVDLDDAEAPTLRFASDGTKLAVEVSDPFGRLERARLFSGVARGAAEAGATLDTSGGGAGLGLGRIYGSGSAMFVDVVPSERTTVTLVLDLDVRVREAKLVPVSLHWFGA